MPKVSGLLVTCERGDIFTKSIESLLAQTVTDWELIIVDDSAGNETAEAVKRFSTDSRIKYFHRETKGSIANASNFGLAKATGEYVAILDDDDWWIDSKKLGKQLAFLDAHRDYVGCGGGIVAMNPEGKELFKTLKPEADEAIRSRALYANPMANSTTVFRRSVATQVGNYDTSLRQFADWDFWLKLGLRGKLYNFPEYFTAYTMWEKGASFAKQKESARAAFRIVYRYKEKYPGYLKGTAFAILYSIYAHLPTTLKKFLNTPLSRLKKALFSR
ncbi:MAG: glycosyltransferase [Candidatus Liptonbacteria bacterium]|nr:glycosyltransferase [Candidatus Liptonbacteria bacterium]